MDYTVSDYEKRRQALDFASHQGHATANDVVKAAQEYYDFLTAEPVKPEG